MIQYLDLTKVFLRSLRINKFNKKGGRVPFYLLATILVLFVFIPALFAYMIFVYDTIKRLNDVDMAVAGFEALLFLISIFSFIFGFSVLLNELYFSEDIENILPFPVKPETLVAAKFTSCFIVENVILFIFLLLAVMSYVFALRLPATYILLSLIGIIFLPIIPMVFCTLLLFIIINLLKRFFKSNSIKKIGYLFISLLVVLVFFVLWKLSSLNIDAYIEEFATGDQSFLKVMRYIFPPVYFFAKGLNDGSIIYMATSIIINLIYICIMLLAAKYLYYDGAVSIISKNTDTKQSSIKQLTNFKIRKPMTHYLIKDLKVIFRSPTFMINCIIINIIWPIFIILIFKAALSDYTISFMRNAIANNNITFYFRMLLFVIGIPIIITSFNSLASSAFSREGKNYYFIKYIPMKYGVQWRAKYLISFIISFLGIIIYTIPFFIIIHLPILKILQYLIITALCISFVSLIGLLIDSSFPKLIWDDESDSLRENYNTFIAMGYSLLLFIVLCGGGYYLFSHEIVNVNELTILVSSTLVIGNIILYLLSNKKISKNINKQEL